MDALGRACQRTPEKRFVSRSLIEDAGGRIFDPPYYFGQYLDMPPITQDVSCARTELDFKPTPFEEGLATTFEAYAKETSLEPDFSWEDRLLASIGQ